MRVTTPDASLTLMLDESRIKPENIDLASVSSAMVDIWQDRPAGSPYRLDRIAIPTSFSEISGLVVLIVSVGYVNVVPYQRSSCYSRVAGVTDGYDCCSGPW